MVVVLLSIRRNIKSGNKSEDHPHCFNLSKYGIQRHNRPNQYNSNTKLLRKHKLSTRKMEKSHSRFLGYKFLQLKLEPLHHSLAHHNKIDRRGMCVVLVQSFHYLSQSPRYIPGHPVTEFYQIIELCTVPIFVLLQEVDSFPECIVVLDNLLSLLQPHHTVLMKGFKSVFPMLSVFSGIFCFLTFLSPNPRCDPRSFKGSFLESALMLRLGFIIVKRDSEIMYLSL